MDLQYPRYDFTPILGWSISRYELFDKCKRQYFYNYYSKFVPGIPSYKMTQLKGLTSVPLEIGNVVHDVIEAFLRRLQQSASNIDEGRFFQFAREKADGYFSSKTFIETYYGRTASVDREEAFKKISRCLENFIKSPCYNWLFMKAITNKVNWMIEPPGMGETRLNGLKAYCKMDFLFPVENEIHILDWKTGAKDGHKHSQQLIGYAAAAAGNFGIRPNIIFPKIIYLYPEFEEFEVPLKEEDFEAFYGRIRNQTEEMQACCTNVENNIPLPIVEFPMTPSQSLCKFCNYQELCFGKKNAPGKPSAF
jgi:CRISPR/Cas system-associated exonuclease Cas4 (RecB family)